MRFVLRLALVIGGLLVLGITAASAIARRGVDVPPSPWIAFVSDQGGDRDLYRMRPDGSQVRVLHDDEIYQYMPAWSPDGKQMAYMAYTGTAYQIFVLRVDDGSVQQVTEQTGGIAPRWSPDGEWIVYHSDREDHVSHIYRVSVDGYPVERLTTGAEDDYVPAWSPDGQWIVFASLRSGNYDIYRMRPNGSDVQRLTSDPFDDYAPDWSPDGQWIVFTSELGGSTNLYRSRPDGSDRQPLTHDLDNVFLPKWSPDGQWIVFSYERGGILGVGKVQPGSRELHPLMTAVFRDVSPTWAPPVDVPFRPLIALLAGVVSVGLGVRRGGKKTKPPGHE